jgi:anaerobic sulfite reductase subunit A
MPITQTMFYFNETGYREPDIHDKGIIIFLRLCDINGIERLDNIFLKNGNIEDPYYKVFRDKVKFFMNECTSGFENCFCVSINSNITENYSVALRLDDEIKADVKDELFAGLFKASGKENQFKPEFIKQNLKKVNVPDADKIPPELFEDAFWDEYSERYIACGRCNTACVTCSCFTVRDITYEDNDKSGERRRGWAG